MLAFTDGASMTGSLIPSDSNAFALLELSIGRLYARWQAVDRGWKATFVGLFVVAVVNLLP